MNRAERRSALRSLAARIDLDVFVEGVLDSYWPRLDSLRRPPSRSEVHAWTRWNVELVLRWLIDDVAPTGQDLEPFRVHARARAEEGLPVDLVPGNFRRGARFGWNAALRVAEASERAALLESADRLFEFVDRVSRIYAEAYEAAARSAPVDSEERLARALVAKLVADEPASAEEIGFAAAVGFRIDGALWPFVVALASSEASARQHAALAKRMRGLGVLGCSAGWWVVGLANDRVPLAQLWLPAEATFALGPLTVRDEVGRVLEELQMVVAIAQHHGHCGRVEAGLYLPELLLRSSPAVAAKIRSAVYGPLRALPELSHTLDVLVVHDFNRQRAAAALPVHRNTLRDRLARIAELTGIDFEQAGGRGLVWLAYLCGSEVTTNGP